MTYDKLQCINNVNININTKGETKKMNPEEIQALQIKADELKKIKDQNRVRARRFLEKRAEAGKKQISAIVHIDVYEEINRRRDRSIQANEPLTAGQIIEQALLATKDFVALDGKVDIDAISDLAESYDKALIDSSVNINDNTKTDITPPELYPNNQLDLLKGEETDSLEMDKTVENIFNQALNNMPLVGNSEYKTWIKNIIRQMINLGGISTREIKAALENHGIKTVKGLDSWAAGTVGNYVAKIKKE